MRPAEVRVRTLEAPNSARRRLTWFDRSRPVAGVYSRVVGGTLSDSLPGDASPAACCNLQRGPFCRRNVDAIYSIRRSDLRGFFTLSPGGGRFGFGKSASASAASNSLTACLTDESAFLIRAGLIGVSMRKPPWLSAWNGRTRRHKPERLGTQWRKASDFARTTTLSGT
jgi:hypothetical protein